MPGNSGWSSIIAGWSSRGTSGAAVASVLMGVQCIAGALTGSASSTCTGRCVPSRRTRISVGTDGQPDGGSRTRRSVRSGSVTYLLRVQLGQFP